MGRTVIWRGALGFARVSAALATLVALLPSPAGADSQNYLILPERWDEDYSYLADPDFKPEGVERLKFLALNDSRTIWFSVGGEARYRVDSVTNAHFAIHPRHDYLSQQARLLLHGDLHFGSYLRIFAQLGYWDEGGREPVAKSFDRSNIDLAQRFVDVSGGPLRLRVGRQELPLGNQRLADVREGQNIRRSFDALRLDFAWRFVHAIAFYGRPVVNRAGAFDDRAARHETFYGVYANARLDQTDWLDVYALVRTKADVTFTEGTADEQRESFGARLFGGASGWDYDLQGLAQTGRFGTEGIFAYAASADVGRSLRLFSWLARLGTRFDLASGDATKSDKSMNSFDAPYPNFSFLSATGAYWPGNAWSIFPLLELEPDNTTTVYLGADYTARMSLADGFYYIPETPIALSGNARGLMEQVYSRARWQPTQHWYVSGTALYQIAGNATRDVGGRNVLILSVSLGAKF
jgi:hypothetical protein